MKYIYLDHAAATPVDPDVEKTMRPYLAGAFYNPSATYAPAVQVRKNLDAARARIAHWLGARPPEITFTAGGTEANNLAIRGVMEQFPGGNVVVSAIEHESVLAPATAIPEKPTHPQPSFLKGRTLNREGICRIASVTDEGLVDPNTIIDLVDDQTVLVSVMYANNEVGTIQPLRHIAREIEKVRAARRKAGNPRPLYFHTDAAQAANYLDLHAARLGVDLMTINGGKIYGPKASGALFVSHRVSLRPLVYGGGQERGLRSGTENVAGAIGLSRALDITQTRRAEESARLRTLQTLFFDLLREKLPQAAVNGSRKHRLPNNIHLTIPGADNERLLLELEANGILAAAGSACSASSGEPSHVLKAMGQSSAQARASLRFTLGRPTTTAEVRKTIHLLTQL